MLALAGILIGAGILLRQSISLVLGSIALTLVLLINGSHLFSFVLDAGWIGLAIAGASTIVTGSLLERFWPVVKLTIVNYFNWNKVGNQLD